MLNLISCVSVVFGCDIAIGPILVGFLDCGLLDIFVLVEWYEILSVLHCKLEFRHVTEFVEPLFLMVGDWIMEQG